MSIIQSLIATSVYVESTPPGPNWIYPPPGNNYPVAGGTAAGSLGAPVSGYYESSSISTPTVGLYRRVYTGTAFGSTFTQDSNFPSTYFVVENQVDSYVGFAFDFDNQTNFTMEWLGFFKPTITGNFVFATNTDDYSIMWIGANAVSGFDNTNSVLQANNSTSGSMALPMVADKYYPVRIRYVENQGGHNFSVWSGISGAPLQHNLDSAATGQFYFDATHNGAFPGSGLII
jgi:hypothetical protein